MSIPRPVLTLAAGCALGGALLATNLIVNRSPGGEVAASAVTEVTAEATPEASTATPDATPDVTQDAATNPPDVLPSVPPPADDEQVRQAVAETGLLGYAGRLPDDRYALLMAVRGDNAVAYLCDGKKIEVWLRGTYDGTTVTATAPDGERLTARLVTGKARIELSALGRDWTFTVSAVDPKSISSVTKKVRS